MQSFLEIPTDFFNGYITHLHGHSPTDTSACSGATAMQRPWQLAKGNGFILVSKCLPGLSQFYK
jgi:hypothetical protein